MITGYYKEYFTIDVDANSIEEAEAKALENKTEWEALQVPSTGTVPVIEDVEEVE
jgi:glutaredoxin